MKLDHIGIVVPKLEAGFEVWRPLVGEPLAPPEEVPGGRIRVGFLSAGGVHVELVEPTADDSAVSKFLSTRGGGLHHVAFAVPDVTQALMDVVARGGRIIDAKARPGSRGRLVGFAHPSAFGGVLVEFVSGAP